MGVSRRLGANERAIRREQGFALALGVTLCIATSIVLSAGWARTLVAPAFPFVPIAMAWSIFDLLTACFLYARFYVSGRPLFAWVGSAYGCSGLLTLAYLATYLHFSTSPRDTIGDQQIAGALYIAWHVLFAVLVPIGILLDVRYHYRLPRERALTALIASATAVLAIATIITIATYVLRDRLPIFAVAGVMEPALTQAMNFIVVLSGIALTIVAVVARKRLYGLPLWLCLALLTSMLEAKLNSDSLLLFSVAWDLGKLLTLSTSSFVMIQALVIVLRTYASISEMMALRTQDAGARLRAIWQIATSERLGEQDHLQLILDVATANIRSRHNVYGVTGQLEDGSVRVTAVSMYGDAAVHQPASAVYSVGTTAPLDDGAYAELYAAGSTLMWQPPRNMPSGLARAARWTYAIGTVIQVGPQTHFLMFGSPDHLDAERFVESDIAFVEVVASIIDRRYYESQQLERIQHQSERDPLTGLYNRTLFYRMGRAATAGRALRAVILIDVDSFSSINHRLGESTGDDLIVEVASSLTKVDHRDVVARVGGDEFGVLVQSDRGDRDLAKAFAAYAELFREPFRTGGREQAIAVTLTASIGIAPLDNPESDFESLQSRAAVALEQSWAVGGNTVTVFGPDLQALLNERSVERAELLEAIAADQLFLVYQPTVELNTETITGAEALVRWQHPVRGVVPPDTLLPAIRRANLLAELTSWVLRKVVRDLDAAGTPKGFRVFINVPSQVLENGSFINNLNQVLFTCPDVAVRLGVEVTESELMHNVELAVESLARARQIGVVVAVDDFGTGYSSLNYLKRLPVDVLKLDKSFIQGLPDDPKDVALAELFIALSRQFGLVSLGEGIETESQADWLREHGCMVGQGYLYSKPVSFAGLTSLLKKTAGSSLRRS